jgi:hypothetical protein
MTPRGSKAIFNYQRILELYKKGFTLDEIGYQVGCSENTAKKVVKEHGLFNNKRTRKNRRYKLKTLEDE